MKRQGSAFYKAMHLSIHEWKLLTEAFRRLFIARIQITFIPFKSIAPQVGIPVKEPLEELQKNELADQIGWAVRVCSRRTCWKSTCLVQALAAQRMLKKRSIPGYLFLGLYKKEEDIRKLKAHAWIRAGNKVQTGRFSLKSYTVVSIFKWS